MSPAPINLVDLDIVTRAAARVTQYNVELARLRRFRHKLASHSDTKEAQLIVEIDERIEEIEGWAKALTDNPAAIDDIGLIVGTSAWTSRQSE